jgi:hypothetical protein
LSRAKDIKDAFKVCPTPDPCLVVEGQRHMRFPGVPRTISSILFIIRIHQIRWRVTGLPTTLDVFNAIPRRVLLPASQAAARHTNHQPNSQRAATTDHPPPTSKKKPAINASSKINCLE